MGISVYTPDNTKILHTTYADFVSRQIGRPIHIVQYDTGLPILAVKLFCDGQPYIIPSNASIHIKVRKQDGKFVYNQALGCDSARHIVFFEITYQMSIIAGDIAPVIEVVIGESVSASSSIGIIIDRNPVQNNMLESTSEWKAINEAVEYAKEAIDAAAKASASRSASVISETNAKTSETNAKTSETNAKASETNAKISEENIKGCEDICIDNVRAAMSYAIGEGNYRENENVDNARFYYEKSRLISESFSGALRPVGTITFSALPNPSVAAAGDMYNISDTFTTTSFFKEGAGYIYLPGTNVYKTFDGYWDCLSGTQVAGIKGNEESAYRNGYVNITPNNIGAYSKSEVDKRISEASFGEPYHGNIDDVKYVNKVYWCNTTSGFNPPTSGTIPENMPYFYLITDFVGIGHAGVQIAVGVCGPKKVAIRDWCNSKWYDWHYFETIDSVTPEFTEASTRENIESKETMPTILGKIKKFFSDLKTVAFTGSYNDLSNKPSIPTVPSSLKNPNALTFTGAVTGSYDGSAAKTVNIPKTGEIIYGKQNFASNLPHSQIATIGEITLDEGVWIIMIHVWNPLDRATEMRLVVEGCMCDMMHTWREANASGIVSVSKKTTFPLKIVNYSGETITKSFSFSNFMAVRIK